MSENKETNNIIDSYDGDPDDLVFFQTPAAEEDYDIEEEDIYEDTYEDIYIEEMGSDTEASPSEPEIIVYENDVDYGNDIIYENSMKETGGSFMGEGYSGEGQSRGIPSEIDLNDPHYANFEIDPYYDLGQGPEPKAKKMDNKQDGSALGVVSLCTAIAANLMCCCGMNYILSLTAIVTGIWCLCLKNTEKSSKIMAIIGIILALLPFAVMILNMFSTVFVDLADYIIDYI